MRDVLELVAHDIHVKFWGGVAIEHQDPEIGDCYKCRVVAETLAQSLTAHGVVLTRRSVEPKMCGWVNYDHQVCVLAAGHAQMHGY